MALKQKRKEIIEVNVERLLGEDLTALFSRGTTVKDLRDAQPSLESDLILVKNYGKKDYFVGYGSYTFCEGDSIRIVEDK